MRSLTIDAFAKINLTLIVQSRRLDGLHEFGPSFRRST